MPAWVLFDAVLVIVALALFWVLSSSGSSSRGHLHRDQSPARPSSQRSPKRASRRSSLLHGGGPIALTPALAKERAQRRRVYPEQRSTAPQPQQVRRRKQSARSPDNSAATPEAAREEGSPKSPQRKGRSRTPQAIIASSPPTMSSSPPSPGPQQARRRSSSTGDVSPASPSTPPQARRTQTLPSPTSPGHYTLEVDGKLVEINRQDTKRKQLQRLCKAVGIRANQKNVEMFDQLVEAYAVMPSPVPSQSSGAGPSPSPIGGASYESSETGDEAELTASTSSGDSQAGDRSPSASSTSNGSGTKPWWAWSESEEDTPSLKDVPTAAELRGPWNRKWNLWSPHYAHGRKVSPDTPYATNMKANSPPIDLKQTPRPVNSSRVSFGHYRSPDEDSLRTPIIKARSRLSMLPEIPGSVTKFRPTPPPPTSAEEDAGSTSTGRRRGGATPRTRDLSPIAMRSTVHLSMDGGSGDTTSSGESPTIAGRTGSQAADNLDDSISPTFHRRGGLRQATR